MNYFHRKWDPRLYLLTLLERATVPPGGLLKVYISMIRVVLEYACAVGHTPLTKSHSGGVESIQKRALMTIYR